MLIKTSQSDVVDDFAISDSIGFMPYRPSNTDMGHERSHSEIQNGTKSSPEPIAICGMALRLPGNIRDPSDFWDVLVNGRDTRGPIPHNRYNHLAFSDLPGAGYGYFLDAELDKLDTSFFRMGKTELEMADPQQRQLLEITRECLESAGEADYRGKPIGCYVGTFGDDWLHILSKDPQLMGGYALCGYSDLMLANRISYEYDFKGPSVVIKTGCSASLIGVHDACRALQARDCDGALVAGTNLIMGPTTTATLAQEGVLSPNASCRTFDADADGYARGEAINAVYLKRLDDAIRDKNPVRAVIRNSGTNSDGRSSGPTLPHGPSHEQLMRKVYSDCGLPLADTAYIECHGTGTPAGDPIEATAIGNVFGEHGILIGSVKPNVGHSEGASGITSLIKAVLAIENKIIPPSIKFVKPNPKIPFEEKSLVVPTSPVEFPKRRAERISVSSYGIGGSNAHVIIDSLQSVRPDLRDYNGVVNSPLSQSSHLLLFSANTENSLRRSIANYQEYLNRYPERATSLAYHLATRKERLRHRTFAILENDLKIDTASIHKSSTAEIPIAMVFSGQGAQWPQMGAELIRKDAAFRDDIVAMNIALHELVLAPTWDLLDELMKPPETSRVELAEFAQPLCTAVQVASVNAYARCGVRPSSVVGHSSGEIAAAYASGALSMQDAIAVAYYRGLALKGSTEQGGMAAVGLSCDEVSTFLIDGVAIACENSPQSVTISGELDELALVLDSIRKAKPDTFLRQLRVPLAYHTEQMRSISLRYQAFLESEMALKMSKRKTRVPFFSTVWGARAEHAPMLDSNYWANNLLCTVKFEGAITKLLKDFPDTIFLEVGPHSTLSAPLRDIVGNTGKKIAYVASMSRGASAHIGFLNAIGQMFRHGIHVDTKALMLEAPVLTDLPTYPWDHESSHWFESRISKAWRLGAFNHHPLLGQRVHESSDLDASWRVMLKLEDVPWLRDHKAQNNIVFPFAGYVAMAGEAIRQLSGAESAFVARRVIVQTGMVLTDLRATEIVTNLRPHRLTEQSVSEWFEFTISSYSGSAWITHCHGQVKKAKQLLPVTEEEVSSVSRPVPAAKWYDTAGNMGLNYGPAFRGLQEIYSSPTDSSAVGRVQVPDRDNSRDAYLTDPRALDSCFQLLLLVLILGPAYSDRLHLPTMMEEIYVSQQRENIVAKAYVSDDVRHNTLDCVADGHVVVRVRNVHFTTIPLESKDKESRQDASSRLHWYPDFDFMNPQLLFPKQENSSDENRLMEETALLCIIQSSTRLEGASFREPHFEKYSRWLRAQVEAASNKEYPLVPQCQDFVRMSESEMLDALDTRFQALSRSPSKRSMAIGLKRLLDNISKVCTGNIDPLDLLLQDGVLGAMYNATSMDPSAFVQALSLKKPKLRILEVGAGTGGTTAAILSKMAAKDCLQRVPYFVYTFTDISAGFFHAAMKKFSEAPNMEYKVLDISKDPLTQGFEPQSYDLILASNSIHATPCLHDSLKNLHCLLRPDGHLLLSELCTQSRATGYFFGVFSGWWAGESDGRAEEPFVTTERWDSEFKAAGFSGVQSLVFDHERPYQYCAAMITQPSRRHTLELGRVALLCNQPLDELCMRLLETLGGSGFEATAVPFGGDLSGFSRIISILDLDKPLLDTLTHSRFSDLQDLFKTCSKQSFLWLMPSAQLKCTEPNAAKSLGFLRILRAELGLSITTLEINKSEPRFPDLVLDVLKKIGEPSTDTLLPDYEYVVDEGVIKIGRYQDFSLEEEVRNKTSVENTPEFALELSQPGLLDSLNWVGRPVESRDLGEDEVEVETRAVGMNFRDVAFALGLISSGTGSIPLGIEMSGIVRRVGKNVSHVAPGDRVIAVAEDGLFASSTITRSDYLVRIPGDLSFEEAATMPTCFATAIRAIIEVGQLQRGETILIHSACGGVGHAAMQLCMSIGAEIYVTVGDETKASYLNKTFGLPRDRIFNSRNTTFLDDLMRATNGRGVDLVLNSLSGELLHASWKCVAEFGKMIELGKRDLAEHGKLDLNPFLANRSYCCVEVAHFMNRVPKKIRQLLTDCLNMYARNQITPIRPMTIFEASEIQQAFRHMQQGNHIGKVVVRFPEDSSSFKCLPYVSSLRFDPCATYLVVGGLGGLGQCVCSWMVQRGAKHIIVLSRSAGLEDDHKQIIADLESAGCAITAVAGEAQNLDDVHQAVSRAMSPIKGVIHLAMVLRDVPFLNMTLKEWEEVLAPKVQGAWNLHEALTTPLDFFVLASSITSIVEAPGQSNYSAANTFLEAFCQYRHHLKLPASVLSICPINDAGYIAQNASAKTKILAQGLTFTSQRALLKNLELAILASSKPSQAESKGMNLVEPWTNLNQIIMGLKYDLPLDHPDNRTPWRRDRRMGFYHNTRGMLRYEDSNGEQQLQSFLSRARLDPKILSDASNIEFLALQVGKKMFKLMLKPEDEVTTSLRIGDSGMDSLIAIEFRRWWRITFGVDVGVVEILGAGTVEDLGKLAAEGFAEKIAESGSC